MARRRRTPQTVAEIEREIAKARKNVQTHVRRSKIAARCTTKWRRREIELGRLLVAARANADAEARRAANGGELPSERAARVTDPLRRRPLGIGSVLADPPLRRRGRRITLPEGS